MIARAGRCRLLRPRFYAPPPGKTTHKWRLSDQAHARTRCFDDKQRHRELFDNCTNARRCPPRVGRGRVLVDTSVSFLAANTVSPCWTGGQVREPPTAAGVDPSRPPRRSACRRPVVDRRPCAASKQAAASVRAELAAQDRDDVLTLTQQPHHVQMVPARSSTTSAETSPPAKCAALVCPATSPAEASPCPDRVRSGPALRSSTWLPSLPGGCRLPFGSTGPRPAGRATPAGAEPPASIDLAASDR